MQASRAASAQDLTVAKATNALLVAENECLEGEVEHMRSSLAHLQQRMDQLQELHQAYVCTCGRPMPPDQFFVAPPTARGGDVHSKAYPEALKAARARHAQQRTKQANAPLRGIRTRA